MKAGLQAQVAELTRRIGDLEDERAILQTLHAYGHAIDYGDEAGWLDCFTPEGIFDLQVKSVDTGAAGRGVPHVKPTRIEGQDALARYIREHPRAPTAWRKHLLVEPCITLSADRRNACVKSYFAVLGVDEQHPTIRAFGRYLDDMIRCADGRWRFRKRAVEIESPG